MVEEAVAREVPGDGELIAAIYRRPDGTPILRINLDAYSDDAVARLSTARLLNSFVSKVLDEVIEAAERVAQKEGAKTS